MKAETAFDKFQYSSSFGLWSRHQGAIGAEVMTDGLSVWERRMKYFSGQSGCSRREALLRKV